MNNSYLSLHLQLFFSAKNVAGGAISTRYYITSHSIPQLLPPTVKLCFVQCFFGLLEMEHYRFLD